MQWIEIFLGNVFPEHNIKTFLGESSVGLCSSPFFPLVPEMTSEGAVPLGPLVRKTNVEDGSTGRLEASQDSRRVSDDILEQLDQPDCLL